MKKRPVLIILIISLLILSSVSFALAKDLEVCYHCGGTGEFHCPSCGNTGYVVCDGCGGAGGSVCPGEDGKGPCDHGYYTCTNCNGAGYTQNYDDKGNPTDTTPCGHNNCNGTGKQECWTCHGSGWNNCTRCGGSGQEECQIGDCKLARNVGWKCPYCNGAGYLLTNFWPGENDGVQNVPVSGDLIWANGKSTTYGGGSGSSGSGSDNSGSSGYSGSGSSGEASGGYDSGRGQSGDNGGGASSSAGYFDAAGSSVGRDPSTGRDLVWFIDVGSGTWDFGSGTVTTYRNGQPASGVLDVRYNEQITLVTTGNTSGMHAYISGADGFSGELEISGGENGEICVGRRMPQDSYVPFELTLSMVLVREEENMNDVPIEVNFGGGSWSIDGKDVYATVNGNRLSGTVSLEPFESIKLNGFNQDTMRARVYGPNGFAVDLNPTGDGAVSIGNTVQGDAVIPPNVTFAIEKKESEREDAQEPEVESVRYDPAEMNMEDRDVFDQLSEEELQGIIRAVEEIVGTARPGSAAGSLGDVIAEISGKNNIDAGGEDALFPIQFDGHIDIGFPVKITVNILRGDLDASRTIHMYHITQEGEVEYLGVAETTEHEDGSVDKLSFYTRSFSDFFASYVELENGIVDAQGENEEALPSPQVEKCGVSVPVLAIVAVIILVAAVALIAKKKKQS